MSTERNRYLDHRRSLARKIVPKMRKPGELTKAELQEQLRQAAANTASMPEEA